MKALIATLLLSLSFIGGAAAEGVKHYVAIHVNENNPKVMNLALNNAANVTKFYDSVGDSVEIELVAYGPGLVMLIEGKSPVADRISVMSLELENVSFTACGNTRAKMSAKAGHEIPLISEATVRPSGVVRLIELQEKGYAYVKP